MECSQVPKGRGRPKKESGSISQQHIIETVKTLTVASKRIPSIRSMAESLDVDPMTIYYYFPSKQAVLEAVASSILESVYQPKSTKNWERELSKLAVSYVDVLREYPGLLETMLSAPMLGPVTLFSERFDSALREVEINEQTRRDALYLFVDYLHGFAYSANCWQEDASQLKTKEALKPLNLLFRGMQL